MLVLDTNHFSEFRRATPAAERLRERLAVTNEEMFLTIISAEEILRGWLSEIRRHADGHRLIEAYRQLQENLEDFGRMPLLPWSNGAEAIFGSLRMRRVRIGTMDLRIASLALAHDATLLTRNIRDLEQVPGLRVENWLD